MSQAWFCEHGVLNSRDRQCTKCAAENRRLFSHVDIEEATKIMKEPIVKVLDEIQVMLDVDIDHGDPWGALSSIEEYIEKTKKELEDE